MLNLLIFVSMLFYTNHGIAIENNNKNIEVILADTIRVDNSIDLLLFSESISYDKIVELKNEIEKLNTKMMNFITTENINKDNIKTAKLIKLYSDKINTKVSKIKKNINQSMRMSPSSKAKSTGRDIVELNKSEIKLEELISQVSKQSNKLKNISKIIYSISK